MSTNSPPSIEVTVPPRRFPSGYVDGVRPSHHMNNSKTRFTNPWPSFRAQTDSDWLSVRSFTQNIGYFNKVLEFTQIFVAAILRSPDIPRDVNHACYLVELPTPPGAARGVRVIFDPVFSSRCSPIQWLGPARYTDTPCKVEEIPPIDATMLSHNHYDHTDIPTLCALLENPSSSAHIFVALNNADYLSKALCTPLSRIHELDWWDERLLHVTLPSKYASDAVVDAEVRLSCTPSQHVSGPYGKVYFAGDTGYRTVCDGDDEDEVPVCPAFAEVGERFGGFDLAVVAHWPRAIVSNEHASPADAVRIFKDLKVKKALAMHWGTWVLGTEPVLEPPILLRKECEKAGLGPDEFLILALGGTFLF
ncbi:N-acyl-phosphatidylethanolamine-hydrolyzing phospholipase D [Lactarius hatsudake]|nr:N-acyl-phosphatidylethanolamine-hydrolyzing phospholipase D [Lactarius hatsudake]